MILSNIVIRESFPFWNNHLCLCSSHHPPPNTHTQRIRTSRKWKHNHTLSPSLHRSRILNKSLLLVTSLPFTDSMMSPRMLAWWSVFHRPCSIEIDQQSLNGSKKPSNLKKLKSTKEGWSKQSILPNNQETNFNDIHNSKKNEHDT